jgi:hypothetical protein
MSDNQEAKAKFTLLPFVLLAAILVTFMVYWMVESGELSSGRYKYAESLNKYPEMKPVFNDALKDGKITERELGVIEAKYKEVEKGHVKNRLNETDQ